MLNWAYIKVIWACYDGNTVEKHSRLHSSQWCETSNVQRQVIYIKWELIRSATLQQASLKANENIQYSAPLYINASDYTGQL